MRRICLTLAAIWLTAPVAAQEPPALQDQFGEWHGLADSAGRPVLVIIASERKLRWLGKWEEALRRDYPDLNSLRIADITEKPRPDEAEVAAGLQARAPAGVSVLIDLDNQWAEFYGLDTGEPNLLLLDDRHQLVAGFRGRPKDPLLSDVVAALNPYFAAPVP